MKTGTKVKSENAADQLYPVTSIQPRPGVTTCGNPQVERAMLDLSRLADRLGAGLPDTVWREFTAFLGDLGFDSIIRYECSAAEFGVRSTLGAAWAQQYQDRKYAAIDPFLPYCARPAAPMATGAAYLDSYDFLTPVQKTLIAEAGEAGFNAGFSVVLPDQPDIAWNIGSSLGRRDVEALRHEMRRSLPLALRMVTRRLRPRVALSGREADVLQLLAAGLRSQEIAHELGLALVTVELHLRNARIKLGARTRDQALLYFSYDRRAP